MWVSSKTAAVALGMSVKSIQKSAKRAKERGAFFCSMIGKNFPIREVSGVGFGGKVLELDVPDVLLAEAGLLEVLLKERGGEQAVGELSVVRGEGSYGSRGGQGGVLESGKSAGVQPVGRFEAHGAVGFGANSQTGVSRYGNGAVENARNRLESVERDRGNGNEQGRNANHENVLAGRASGASAGAGSARCGVASDRSVGLPARDHSNGRNESVAYGSASGNRAFVNESSESIERGVGVDSVGIGGVSNGNEYVGVVDYGCDCGSADVVGSQDVSVSVAESKDILVNSSGLTVIQARAVHAALAFRGGEKKMDHYRVVAQMFDVSVPTLLRWVKLAGQAVPESKANKQVVFDGVKIKTSAFDVPAVEWAIAVKLNRLGVSISEIYKELVKEAKVQNWRIGSEKRLYAFFNREDVKLMIEATAGGERAIRNKFVHWIKRAWDSWRSLELVVGDQLVSDYYVWNEETGEMVTPEFYVFADMSSRRIVGISMKLGAYNKYVIADAFKQVCEFGIPEGVYTDNGRPELSKYFAGVQAQLKGINVEFNTSDSFLKFR